MGLVGSCVHEYTWQWIELGMGREFLSGRRSGMTDVRKMQVVCTRNILSSIDRQFRSVKTCSFEPHSYGRPVLVRRIGVWLGKGSVGLCVHTFTWQWVG